MNIAENIVVFLVSWWMVLFIVLPIGVRTSEEAGEEIVPGTAHSAPAHPRILLKMGITTVGAAVIWFLFWLADRYDLVTARDFYS